MAAIQIIRAHDLGRENAQKIVQKLVDKLTQRFGGKASWQEGSVHYSHAGGVDGCIRCDDREIAIDVELGFMMAALRGVIETEISESLDKYL